MTQAMAEKINRAFYQTMLYLGRDKNFNLQILPDGNISKVEIIVPHEDPPRNSVIALSIGYEEKSIFEETIAVPVSFLLKYINNLETGSDDTCYTASSATPSYQDSKLISFDYGDGRTSDFLRYYSHPFVRDMVHQWLPKAIIYHNPDRAASEETIYTNNQRIEVFKRDYKDYETIVKMDHPTYKFYHNSGYIYSQNRFLYNFYITNGSLSSDKVEIATIKPGHLFETMNPTFAVSDSVSSVNSLFEKIQDNRYICYHIAQMGKDKRDILTALVGTDKGCISFIDYYDFGYGSNVRYHRINEIQDQGFAGFQLQSRFVAL